MNDDSVDVQLARELRFSRAAVSCMLTDGCSAPATLRSVTMNGLQLTGRVQYEKGQQLTVSISTRGLDNTGASILPASC